MCNEDDSMDKPEIDVKYLEQQEVAAIIESAESKRDKAMLAVIYQCGLRRAEVGLLLRDDYNRPRSMLRVTRLKKRDSYWHELVLWASTKRLLDQYLKQREEDKDYNDALFPSRKGGMPISHAGVYWAFVKAAEKAGVRIKDKPDERGNRHPSPHRLRHSIAVHQMNCGIDIVDIQEHLAHAKIETTLVYARIMTPRKKRNAMLMQASHHFAKF